MKYIYLLILSMMAFGAVAQPTFSTSPSSFTAEDEVVLTVDVTGTTLDGYSGDVWMWSWVAEGCSTACDAPSNIDPAGSKETEDAKMTRDESNPNVYTITFTPVDFFAKSASELKKIGFKLKSESWDDGKDSGSDAILSVEPLTFTPTVDRRFPTKATSEDVITLYLDQSLADEPDLKYQLGQFEVQINALDSEGNILATITKDAINESEGLHFVRVLPVFDFSTTSEITALTYTFISKDNPEINSPEFSIEFLNLK